MIDDAFELEELILRTERFLSELWEIRNVKDQRGAAEIYSKIRQYEKRLMAWRSQLDKLNEGDAK